MGVQAPTPTPGGLGWAGLDCVLALHTALAALSRLGNCIAKGKGEWRKEGRQASNCFAMNELASQLLMRNGSSVSPVPCRAVPRSVVAAVPSHLHLYEHI